LGKGNGPYDGERWVLGSQLIAVAANDIKLSEHRQNRLEAEHAWGVSGETHLLLCSSLCRGTVLHMACLLILLTAAYCNQKWPVEDRQPHSVCQSSSQLQHMTCGETAVKTLDWPHFIWSNSAWTVIWENDLRRQQALRSGSLTRTQLAYP